MGLELRGNNVYLYRKERRGKRVVSVYVGKGDFAILLNRAAKLDVEKATLQERRERRDLEEEMESQDALDHRIDELCADASTISAAFHLANGYHEHARSWRRKRDGKNTSEK